MVKSWAGVECVIVVDDRGEKKINGLADRRWTGRE